MILTLWPPALQYQLPALFFVCVLLVLFLLFIVVLSGAIFLYKTHWDDLFYRTV